MNDKENGVAKKKMKLFLNCYVSVSIFSMKTFVASKLLIVLFKCFSNCGTRQPQVFHYILSRKIF